jgi:uncharacterized membrane protein YhaH (DUF805 family)
LKDREFNLIGRRGRTEHVCRYFVYAICSAICGFFVDLSIGSSNENLFLLTLLFILPINFVILYLFMVNHVKRLHDLNKSGWWALLFFVPFVNVVFLFYLFLAKGQAKDNQYGQALPILPDTLIKRSNNGLELTRASQTLSLELSDLTLKRVGLSIISIVAFFTFWVYLVI